MLPEKFTPEFEREQNFFGDSFDKQKFIGRFARSHAEELGRPDWERDIAYEAGLELSRITNTLAVRVGENTGADLGAVDDVLEEMYQETWREVQPEAIERRARETVEKGRLVPGATYETALRAEIYEVADRLAPRLLLINFLQWRRSLERQSLGQLLATMDWVENELFKEEKRREIIDKAKVPDYVPSDLASTPGSADRNPDAPPEGFAGPPVPEVRRNPEDMMLDALKRMTDTMRGEGPGTL